MVSAKQWGYVVKGARKLGHAIRGGRGSIHMAKDAAGAFTATGKRATLVGEGIGAASRKIGRGVNIVRNVIAAEPNLTRTAVLSGAGAGIGIASVRSQQKQRAVPRSRAATTGELVAGALGGGLAGAWASKNIGWLSRSMKPTIKGLKTKNPDAILRTATVGIAATSGGVASHERQRRLQERTGIKNRKSMTALAIGSSALTGAAFAVPGYAWARSGAMMAKSAAPLAAKGGVAQIAKLGVLGSMTGFAAMGGASKISDTSPHHKTKRVLLATHGAIQGLGLGGLIVRAGQQFGYEFGKAKMEGRELRFKMPKFAKAPKSRPIPRNQRPVPSR